ncbi:hypothetical protein F5882DRAFT_170965 [Hyaloscypha sp. PMI_1271]|nr:hypothetical protein F5882DRAFT_170965 [Hyaloscypha sp. PMI_1271]
MPSIKLCVRCLLILFLFQPNLGSFGVSLFQALHEVRAAPASNLQHQNTCTFVPPTPLLPVVFSLTSSHDASTLFRRKREWDDGYARRR